MKKRVMLLVKYKITTRTKENEEYHKRQLWPKIDKIAISEDGVGLAKLFINKVHDKR